MATNLFDLDLVGFRLFYLSYLFLVIVMFQTQLACFASVAAL